MSRTMLRFLAPLLPSIVFASALLASADQAAHAQGWGVPSFGGQIGGGGDRDRGPGILRDKGPDRNFGPQGLSKERFLGGPKGMSNSGERGGRNDGGRNFPSAGDFYGRNARGILKGEREKGERDAKNGFPNRIGGKAGREKDYDQRGLGKFGETGADKRGGRFPKQNRDANGDNAKAPWMKGDRAATGNPRHPWGKGERNANDDPRNSRSKGGDVGSADGKAPWGGTSRDPRNPKGGDVGSAYGKAPWGGTSRDPRNPKGGDVGSADGKSPWGNGRPSRGDREQNPERAATGGDCVGRSCTDTPGPSNGGGSPRPDPIPTGGGGDCVGRNCTDTPSSTDTPPRPIPTNGSDGTPCRGSYCDGGEGRPQAYPNPPCRGRNCGETPPYRDPPRRPPIVVIGPMFPLPEFGDDAPETPYNPPYAATPVYEPATPNRPRAEPVRPREPARQVERTPPSSTPPSSTPPPSAFTPAIDAPVPSRRAFITGEPPRYRPNELLVTVQGADPEAVAGQLAQSFNLTIEESQGFTLLEDRRLYRFGIPDNRAVEGLVAAVANAPGVAQTSPNFYHYLQGANGAESLVLQYALPKLRVPDTHDLVTGRGVTIAVIDSGVDTEHPDLKTAQIVFYDAVDGGVKDPDQHGTAIAGIIAGKGDVAGIAPGIKMLAIRAFAPERLGGLATTTSMNLARATDMGFARGARIFNMSFAGPADPTLLALIDAAYAKGAVFIAAAGNQGPNAPPAYPAAYEKVIGITATDEDDVLYPMANRGNYVSIAAPGVDILVPVTGKALDYMSGTSFAAAHITGVVALLMERNPKLGPEEVRDILMEAARDLGKTGRDDDFGAGLADAYEAVTMASPKLQSSINP